MEELNNCPVCGNHTFAAFLHCTDHFLTQEQFTIVSCATCTFKFVNPRPHAKHLARYYDSPEYVSHSGTKQGFINTVYALVKKYTLSRKFLLINRYSKGKSILDIGCATGDFLSLFHQNKWHCLGLEPNEHARKQAAQKHGLNTLPMEAIETLQPQSFDVITLWHVLEHVSDLNQLMVQIKHMLKPDGILVVALPNCDSHDAQHYGPHWAGYDVPRHLYHFNRLTFSTLARNHAFHISATLPMRFDAYYVSMLSEQYKSGGHLLKALFNGWRSNLKALRKNEYSSLVFVMKHAS